MGHALGQQVIAEGVETVEQATRLQELDCDIAQGYYFAKPMEPEAFTVLLEERAGQAGQFCPPGKRPRPSRGDCLLARGPRVTVRREPKRPSAQV